MGPGSYNYNLLHNYSMYVPVNFIVIGIPNPACPMVPQLPLTSTWSPMSLDNTEYYGRHTHQNALQILCTTHILFDFFKVVEAVLF